MYVLSYKLYGFWNKVIKTEPLSFGPEIYSKGKHIFLPFGYANSKMVSKSIRMHHDVFQPFFPNVQYFPDFLLAFLGPVIQSIVSLTSSLRGQLVKCFMTLSPNTLKFVAEKSWRILDINV